jgi:hypothetical protein
MRAVMMISCRGKKFLLTLKNLEVRERASCIAAGDSLSWSQMMSRYSTTFLGSCMGSRLCRDALMSTMQDPTYLGRAGGGS